MSRVSLLKINHECSEEILECPEEFASLLFNYLRRPNEDNECELRRFGVYVLGEAHNGEIASAPAPELTPVLMLEYFLAGHGKAQHLPEIRKILGW
jgi:hypothetical protein